MPHFQDAIAGHYTSYAEFEQGAPPPSSRDDDANQHVLDTGKYWYQRLMTQAAQEAQKAFTDAYDRRYFNDLSHV